MALDIPSGIWSLPMAFAQKSQFITTWGNPPPAAALPAHVCLGMNWGEFPSQWGLLGGRNVKGHGLAPGGRGDGRNWDWHTHATDTKYKEDSRGQPAVPQRELDSELSGGLSGKEAQTEGLCVHTRARSHFSHVRPCATPWTVACQAPLSTEFSRKEYWSGSPCPPPGGLPDSGMEPVSLPSPALAGGFFTTSAAWEAHVYV